MCACVCVRAFMLYALKFDSMYLPRTCKRLGPVRVRCSKYSLLLLLFCSRQAKFSIGYWHLLLTVVTVVFSYIVRLNGHDLCSELN